MKGFLSKMGDKVSDGLKKADEAIDNAGDKIKDAVKSDEAAFVAESFSSMQNLADSLNELSASEQYKSFKVLGTVNATDGTAGVEALLLVVKK